jgi:hypothetical protein
MATLVAATRSRQQGDVGGSNLAATSFADAFVADEIAAQRNQIMGGYREITRPPIITRLARNRRAAATLPTRAVPD